MNRAELEAKLAEKTDLPKATIQKVLVAYEEAIGESLKDGQPVRLTGFGVFDVQHRKARKGRNPQTGAEIDIPASKRLTFKPGKAFTEKVA